MAWLSRLTRRCKFAAVIGALDYDLAVQISDPTQPHTEGFKAQPVFGAVVHAFVVVAMERGLHLGRSAQLVNGLESIWVCRVRFMGYQDVHTLLCQPVKLLREKRGRASSSPSSRKIA